ncbi:MAG TPA: hypothetical protein VHM26_12140, partial [Chitinophagaceae bacterium]|nr:hypothetical protein [Chitinophagaceae bacterium]
AGGTGNETINLAYDDKLNPFHSIEIPTGLVFYWGHPVMITPLPGAQKNNLIGLNGVPITFTYNAHNYPVTMSIQGETSKYIFLYKE